MPTPVVPYQIPDWANPANASVLDSWAQKAIRTLGGLAGVADPVSQVMGLAAAPIDVPAANLAEGLGAKTLKAYHGSPHDFDQFSLGKIGTGEGGQAYGHGLYFAENPAVAAEYRKMGEVVPAIGKQPAVSAHELIAHDVLSRANSLDDALKLADEVTKPQGIDPRPVKKIITENYGQPIGTMHKGATYEVNLHASPDELLDWDKPLSQQSPKVQEALKKAGIITGTKQMEGWKAHIGPGGVLLDENASGDKIYSALVGESGGRTGHTEGIASQKLKDAGIKGIQYLDQGSRTTGQVVNLHGKYYFSGSSVPYESFEAAEKAAEAMAPRTRNFVIFDDKIIEIAKKYGVALPVAAEIFRRQQIGAKNGNVESSVAP